MKRLLVFISVILWVLPWGSSLAYALSRQNYLIATPSLGFFRYANKRHLDSAMVPAIEIGYGFSERISGELLYASLSSNNKGEDHDNVEGDLYAVNGLYHFRLSSAWQPYLTAGVGAMQLNPPTSQGDAKVQANLNAGAGLEYRFSDRISLQASVHDFYTMVGGKNDILILGGLTFYFWKF